jgi:hypothetical protein
MDSCEREFLVNSLAKRHSPEKSPGIWLVRDALLVVHVTKLGLGNKETVDHRSCQDLGAKRREFVEADVI